MGDSLSRQFLREHGYSEGEIAEYYQILQKFRKQYLRTPQYAPDPHERYIKCPDGVPVFVEEWIPPRPRGILLCQHGNMCQADLYYPLADFLYPKGFGVIAIDNRGHGRSGPQRGDLDRPDQMFAIYNTLVARYKDLNCHMLGESLGTTMITAYFAKSPTTARKLKSIILMVAPYRLRLQRLLKPILPLVQIFLCIARVITMDRPFMPFKPDFRPTYYHGYHKIDQMDRIRSPKTTARQFIRVLELIQLLQKSAGALARPLLAMIGTNDQMLDPHGVLQLIKDTPQINRKVVIFRGADHGLLFDKNSQRSYAIIASWLEKYSK